MPSMRAFFANFGAPMPLSTKLRLMLRNSVYKIVHRKDCCGHPGEPGC